MGLDLALGGLVLLTAIRGWLKGFLVQAIRLAGAVASVYAAGPIRDQLRPYAAAQLPTMRPDLLDRILWWASGFGSYFALVGVASLIVAVSRRQTFGMAEPNRGDQFAGFGLGVLKGLVVASFVVAGLQRYGEPQLVKLSWAEDQKKESYAWKWNEEYHPAARIWHAPPVQNFVRHIQRMGLPSGAPKPKAAQDPEAPVQTASRTPRLTLPAAPRGATAMGHPRSVKRPRLVLKKPFSLPESRGKAGEAAAQDPFDTSGVDPEVANTVQSILSRLQEMPETP